MSNLKSIILIFSTLIPLFLSAQEIPQDKDLLKGKLDNGLTYYIKQNSTPTNKVELRLVVNAGSNVESENQRGLAHFMEHLAFSGTRDFPGLKLIDTLQNVGVRFGKELNAYTSFDETVYMLPIASENVDLGLNILANWAFHFALTEHAIDRERGVVLEEMRLGNDSRMRLQSQYMPIMFEGTPYPNRLPIGLEDIVKNSPYSEFNKFYKTWYRPDLIAVIAVGDINPLEIEKKIKELFNITSKDLIYKKRESYSATEHKEPKIIIATDKERKSCSVEILYKHKPKRINSVKEFKESLKDDLFRSIMLDRLDIVQDRSEVPFYESEISYSSHFRDIDTYSMFAFCALPDVKSTLEILINENERVRRYGFTQKELELSKKRLEAKYKRWYNEGDKTASDLIADIYQVSYLLNQPATSAKWEYETVKEFIKELSLKDMNKLCSQYTTDKNCVLTIIGPETKEYPSTEELKSLLANAKSNKIEPFIELPYKSQLFDKSVESGKCIKEEQIDSLGIVRFTLSNGLKVILKPTQYKNNQILFRSTSNGGYGMYPGNEAISAVNATLIQDNSGVNKINNIQLKRLMYGKDIAIKQYLTFSHEAMWGKTSKEDIETLFQLINLYHTEPYFNDTAYKKFVNKNKDDYSYLLNTASSSYDYRVDSLMNGGDFRCSPWPILKELNNIDLNISKRIYKERFSNAAGFTFMFVGNINIEEFKPLIERYIASLPVNNSKITKTEFKPYVPKGGIVDYFRKGNADKATVKIRFAKEMDKNKIYNKASYNAFIEILNTRLFESMRVKMSGVYGVSVSGETPIFHTTFSKLNFAFSCNPEMCDSLVDRLKMDLRELWQNGPTQDEVETVKEKLRVALEADYHSNAHALNELLESIRDNKLPQTYNRQMEEIELITVESIIKAAKLNVDIEKGNYFIHLPNNK